MFKLQPEGPELEDIVERLERKYNGEASTLEYTLTKPKSQFLKDMFTVLILERCWFRIYVYLGEYQLSKLKQD